VKAGSAFLPRFRWAAEAETAETGNTNSNSTVSNSAEIILFLIEFSLVQRLDFDGHVLGAVVLVDRVIKLR
jgi:hypothetical protein